MAPSQWRTNMISAFKQARPPAKFLRSLFQTPPGNISRTEQVTVDVQRTGEKISPVVNLCNGHNINTLNVFTNKLFTPPTLAEAMPFECRELMQRMPGMNEYQAADVEFQAQLVQLMLDGFVELGAMIDRNIELQCSQVLQLGVLTLKDQAGNDAYVVDYKPKATHLPTAGVAWTAGGGDPLGDINSLGQVLRTDGQLNPDRLIMGGPSLDGFLSNTDVQARLDNRRMELGAVDPKLIDSGGVFYGYVWIGAYRYEIWTYANEGELPGASTNTQFIANDTCIVMSSKARLDLVFAGIPQPVAIDPRFAGFLPGRMAIPGAADIMPNIWTNDEGTQTMIGAQSRPLAIPTQIDAIGNIDTQVP